MGLGEEIRLNTPSFTAWFFFSVKEQVFLIKKVWFRLCPGHKDQRKQVFEYPLTAAEDSSSVNLTSKIIGELVGAYAISTLSGSLRTCSLVVAVWSHTL